MKDKKEKKKDKRYDTVIFDLDGTLLNTLEDLTDAVNTALEKCGHPRRSIEEVCKFVGNGVKVLIDRAVPERTSLEDTKKCLGIFREYYQIHCKEKTKPYDSIVELLKKLKEMEVKTAVVSNKFDLAVKELCNDFFSGYIDTAIGASEEVPKKPAPDSVWQVLKELGKRKEQAVYVGDSEVDIETGKNAGLPVVSVTWGFRKKEFLKEKNPAYMIDSPMELIDIITNI